MEIIKPEDRKYIELKKKSRYKRNNVKPYRVEQFDDLVDNGGELVLSMIKDFLTRKMPRFDRLDDYYMAENTDIYGKDDRQETYGTDQVSDHRVSHSFGEFITSFLTSYIVGQPITYDIKQSEEGKENADIKDAIDEFNLVNDINVHNYEVMTDASIYGEGMELIYQTGEGEDAKHKVVVLDRLNCFLVYDMTVENNIVAGVYFIDQEIDGKVMHKITVYSDKDIWESEMFDDGADRVTWKIPALHPYGEVPMNNIRNNRRNIGDYERVIPQIDAYDAAQSDTANYMTDLTDAVLAIWGSFNTNLTDEQVNALRKSRILLLGTSISENGSNVPSQAGYLYKQYDVQGVEAYKKRLENDIHKLSYTPNFNDEKFGGALSGEALSYKIIGLGQTRAAKTTYFTMGLDRRYRMLATAKNINPEKLMYVTYQFHPNLPKAVLEEFKAFMQSGGELSQKTKLSLLSFVKDPDEEIKQIEAEKQEAMDFLALDAYEQFNGRVTASEEEAATE